MWWWNRKKTNAEKELSRLKKVEESQLALLSAVTTTADAAQDVTTALKARLDDSLKQLEYTANLLSDALIICQPDGKIDSFNPAAERMFGWKAQDVIGQNVDIIFRKANGRKSQADEVWACLDHQCAGESDGAHSLECIRGKRRSGELFYVDGDINYLERLDGSTIVMMLIKDITTRIELQKQLQLNETRYRSIFENSFDGIVVMQNYHMVAANPAIEKLLGYSPEEMIAKPGVAFVSEEHARVVVEMHTARMNGDTAPRHVIIKCKHKDGREIEMLLTTTLMMWEGKPASLIAIKDVSSLVKIIAESNQ